MGDLSNLADRIDKFVVELPTTVNSTAMEVANTILLDLTEVTPVDKGDALSNWQASLDAPVNAPIPAFAPSPRGRMVEGRWTHTVSPEATREANAPATLAAGKIIIEGKQPGQPVFLTNVLPYIQGLNEGNSEQAPAGFVDRAVILGRSVIERLRFIL